MRCTLFKIRLAGVAVKCIAEALVTTIPALLIILLTIALGLACACTTTNKVPVILCSILSGSATTIINALILLINLSIGIVLWTPIHAVNNINTGFVVVTMITTNELIQALFHKTGDLKYTILRLEGLHTILLDAVPEALCSLSSTLTSLITADLNTALALGTLRTLSNTI